MKRTGRILAAVLVLMLAAGGAMAEGLKIGIITQKENGAFLDMREGILGRLAEAGITEASDEIVYQSVQGDSTTLATICNSMDGYDLVFTIATPATQQFVNLESETPLFFCSVSAPVAAGVITDMAAPDKNATGTSNAIPVAGIFALADALTPGIEKWGLIYSTGETNAVNTINACIKYLEDAGVAYVAAAINSSADVAAAAETLAGDGVGAIFVPNDSNVQAGVASLAETCAEYKIPTYCSSATTVMSGCFATIAIDDRGIGEKTAEMALEYLGGKAVKDIPSIVVPADYISVNTATMQALGIDLAGAQTLSVGGMEYQVKYLSAQ